MNTTTYKNTLFFIRISYVWIEAGCSLTFHEFLSYMFFQNQLFTLVDIKATNFILTWLKVFFWS